MNVIHFLAPPLPHYISSGFMRYKPGQMHANRSRIEVFDLLVVKQGTLYLVENGHSFEVKEGHALILGPDAQHYGNEPCSESTDFYWLHFQTTGEWRKGAEDFWNGETLPVEDRPFFRPIERFTMTLPRFHKLANAEQAYNWLETLDRNEEKAGRTAQWERQLIFQQLLFSFGDTEYFAWESPPRRLADNVTQFLRNRYRDRIDHATIREVFHFHPVYVTRCMKQYYGCTPLEYLNHYRIEQSKLLLKNSDMPVQRVAGEVGFNSSSYFIRMFTQLNGHTPKSYRASFQVGKTALKGPLIENFNTCNN